MEQLRTRPLARLGLQARARNAFAAFGLSTVGDIVDVSERDLCTIPGIGQASMRTISEALTRLSIHWNVSGGQQPKQSGLSGRAAASVSMGLDCGAR